MYEIRPAIKYYRTKHAVRQEYCLRFLFTCFVILSLYSLGSWYNDNLKRSMTIAFTESISGLNDMSEAFGLAQKMTLNITEKVKR